MFHKAKATREVGPLTVLDKAEDRFQKIMDSKAAANERARVRIIELSTEKDALRKEIDEAAEIAAKLTAEYAGLLAGFQAEEAAAIKDVSVVEDDLKAGRVSAQEFLRIGKRSAEIEAEAGSRAEERLAKVRDAIRGQKFRIYEIAALIRNVEEKIARESQGVAENFYYELDAMRRELRESGAIAPGIERAHARKKEADNDLGLAKGAVLFHAKQWTCRTLAEVAEIPLDPVLQSAHFEAFKKFYASVRGLDFAEITVCYTPCAVQGREAGEFWRYIRPNVIVKR